MRRWRREHYYRNKQQYFDRNKIAVLKKKKYIEDLKSSTPCADCKKCYPYFVMDFDHREPSEKLDNISKFIRKTWTQLKAEINKCDIVCSNCHRFRTQTRLDSSSNGKTINSKSIN